MCCTLQVIQCKGCEKQTEFYSKINQMHQYIKFYFILERHTSSSGWSFRPKT